MQKNGYFQLNMKDEGIFIQIFSPTDGGNPVIINEVIAYLDKYKYNQYDLKELNRAVCNIDKSSEVRVADYKGDSIDEVMDLEVSLDKMLLNVRFYPASNNGQKLTMEEMHSNLESMGIQVEINQKVLDDFLKEPEYCTPFMLAKGIPPVQGKNAEIEYFFNTNHNMKPKKNEDGTVNYKELNTIGHVNAGDRLALLHKEDPGEPGMDIFGEPKTPNQVKVLKFSYANNISLSEDGTELFSDVTGHASLVDGKVFVSDVFEVPADVDNSTGNIDYAGNVHVKGNVKGGFEIKAKGDVIIEGVVEDATVIAGGQIVVSRGIHGMTKGILQAKGNIITKFIENAIVKSGGYVETELIMHSKVSASTEIHVAGKKGLITGGVIRAGNLIEAQTLGSEMGAHTEIEVGTPPEEKERLVELGKSIEAHRKEVEQIKPILVNFTAKMSQGTKLPEEKMNYVKKLAETYRTLKEELATEQAEQKALHHQIAMSNRAKVIVRRDAFPGVSIVISDVKMFVKTQRSFCQYVKENGEIVAQNLS